MSKKKLGAKSFFYPMITTIVGANVNKKPNFVTIAFCGMIQYRPPLLYISSGKNHYTNIGIKENQTFSINFPSTDMAKITDYIGINSGKKIDKSTLFDVFYGMLETAPMIDEAPLNHECKVERIIDFGSTNEMIIGEITNSYIDEKCLINGKPDINKLRPILYSGYDSSYIQIGDKIGQAFKIGREYKKE